MDLLQKSFTLGIRQISNFVISTAFAQQISQVWNNADLYGHTLTSAPKQLYAFATSPLTWHLSEDGTDRRARIWTFPRNAALEHEAECELFPFELFEFIYKRVIGGTLMAASGMISPIGLMAKGTHLLARSVFS